MPRHAVRRLLPALPCLVLALALQAQATAVADEPLAFGHIFDNAPLDVTTPRRGETFTAAVEQFHVTGENPYSGDEAAAAAGRPLYARWCQACHMPDGSGRMGPSLIDGTYAHERVATDKGFFEVLYGGAAGAMQSFASRIDQDDLLKIMAYVETLKPD